MDKIKKLKRDTNHLYYEMTGKKFKLQGAQQRRNNYDFYFEELVSLIRHSLGNRAIENNFKN
jgi:hypothetical protein